MWTRTLDDEAALRAGVARFLGAQSAARCEPDVGIVGADIDDQFTGNAVRFRHAPDDQLHVGAATGRCPPRRPGYHGHRYRPPACATPSRYVPRDRSPCPDRRDERGPRPFVHGGWLTGPP